MDTVATQRIPKCGVGFRAVDTGRGWEGGRGSEFGINVRGNRRSGVSEV